MNITGKMNISIIYSLKSAKKIGMLNFQTVTIVIDKKDKITYFTPIC